MVDINTIKLNLTTTYFLDITIDPSIYLLIKIKILKIIYTGALLSGS